MPRKNTEPQIGRVQLPRILFIIDKLGRSGWGARVERGETCRVEVTWGDWRVILEPISHGAGPYTFEESFDECDWLGEVNERRLGLV